MADLQVTIGADISQYKAAMAQSGAIAESTSSEINKSFNQMGNSAQSMSMRFMQMRSGLSAVRDGAMGLVVGGQRADMMFMAMGHHFTSLINETGSLKGAFGALASSLVGPGGVIIGLTLAYEIFKHFSKEAKEAKDTLKNYEESLDAVTGATLKGAIAGANEITRLKILYDATQNHALSLKARNQAYDELERKYPAFFTNAEREKTLLGENKIAYDALAGAIMAAAYAKAYEAKIGENATRDLENQQKVVDLRKKQLDLDKAIAYARNAQKGPAVSGGAGGSGSVGYAQMEAQALKDKAKIQGEINNLLTDSNLLTKQNADLAMKATEQEAIAGFKTETEIDGKNSKLKAEKGLLEQLEEQAKKLRVQLENAVVSHQPTVAHQLAIDLENLEDKIKGLKTQIANSLLAGGGKAPLTALGTDVAITGGDVGLSNTGQNVEEDIKKHNQLQTAIQSSIFLGKAWKKELKEEAATVRELSRVVGVGLMNAFQSALSGTESFVSAMGHFLAQLIEKLIAAAAAAAILAVLLQATGFGAAIGAESSFGAIFGQLAGFSSSFGGGSSGGGGGFQGFATGGIFTTPRVGMFAEAGPEAIVTPKHLAEFAGVQSGSMELSVEHRISGPDLLLTITRAQKQKGRLS